MTDALPNDIENIKILLVDDDPFMLRIIEKVLTGLGFQNLQKAADGQEALNILNNDSIDLLLSDIQMPQVNGLELLKRIRCGKTSAPRNQRTIIVTSFSNTETLGTTMALDVNGFLTKPFKPITVMQTIIKALSDGEAELRSESEYLDVITELSSLGQPEQAPESDAKTTNAEPISIHQLQPNMRLAKDIKTTKGVLLLSAGFILTKSTISRLFDLGDVIANKEYYIEPDE